MSTKPINSITTTSKLERKLSASQQNAIVTRLTALAEAVKENLSPSRIDLYVQALDDLPFTELCGVLEEGIKSLRWFPKIPEIREACGVSPKQLADRRKLEAEQDWEIVLADVLGCGFDDDNYWYGVSPNKKYHNERLDYALRQVGGIGGIVMRREEGRHWCREEFIAAHMRYVETGGLTASGKELEGMIHQLAQGMNMNNPRKKLD